MAKKSAKKAMKKASMMAGGKGGKTAVKTAASKPVSKPVSKSVSKPVKKSAKKAARRPVKKPAKRAGAQSRGGSLAPAKVTTGKGMSAMEVGNALLQRVSEGNYETSGSLWSEGLVSVEGVGVELAWSGMAAVRAKNEEWYSTHRIHGFAAEGPFVGASGFAVKFQRDVEVLATGQRKMMSEIGVYTVEGGKIVREEFMFEM